MNEKYLVVNGGSSSLKFSLYQIDNFNELNIVNGLIERIGYTDSLCTLKYNGKKTKEKIEIPNHKIAVETMLKKLKEYNFINKAEEILGVGHRVLHGGEYYNNSVLITDEVLNNMKSLEQFGPLHLPGEIAGIKSIMETLPNVPQIAAFDTAFHQTIPEYNYIYAIPSEYYTKYGIRKYGFHGTSHKYITEVMKQKLGKENVNIISCHLGNGSSICAIKDGKSLNTSMGFTPIDGVIMGSRCGSIDPSILEYICKIKNINIQECTNELNKQSGLLGISSVSSDLRDIINVKNENHKALLAIKMLENSIIKYIAQYFIELDGKIDAIVFTAGIGENNSEIRENIINKLANSLKIKINKEMNDLIASFKDIQEGIITTEDSKYPVYVIPTDEEYMILKDTINLTKEYNDTKTYKLEKRVK